MSQLQDSLVNGGLDYATVEAISALKNEPAWLRTLRREAFAAYETIPMPTLQDEEWRRTDVRGLRLTDVVPFALPPSRVTSVAALSEDLRRQIVSGDQTGGLLVQQDVANVFSSLGANFAEKGVIFCDLDTAVREHGELVQRYLAKVVPADYSKFSALNTAFWSGGVFLYVPRGVEVGLPLQAMTWLSQDGLSNFSHTIIVAEPDSDVVLIDSWGSPNHSKLAISANVEEVFVGQGARVRYITLQEWGRHLWNFSINRAQLSRDSSYNSLVVAFGSRFHKANVETALQGPGSSGEMLGVLCGDQRQFFDHHTVQDHQAHHTSSDLLYKSTLTDRARSVFSGLIHARKTAQKTDAIQTNRNLLLSDGSRADSIPNLEIETNDLRCTHAATIAPVDDEQMFYLRARGLTETDAKRVIVEGFFEPLLERIPLAGVVERLRQTISGKIGD
ncbi:MAG TPA: Fe-S cluster assembly protein SufD [Chloroflexota bacterium]|nr:Fe-S cluster assembly protein SufD [Chloroflexota bacterium]